jgi:steroid 5-alpha reductase family enzyme
MIAVLRTAALAVMSLQILTWLISVRLRDVSIVDRIWGLTFVCGTVAAVAHHGVLHSPAVALTGLIAVWGLRLSLYIHIRNKGHAEDYRYQAMRAKNPRWFWLVSCVTVFLFQGLISLVIGLPVYSAIVAVSSAHEGVLALGAVLAGTGIAYEAVADGQLRRFKADPQNQGKLMSTGLWKLSRHPNYFGEIVVWWGIWLTANSVQVPLWTIMSPILITFLLTRVTGVTMLEKSLRKSKPGYEDYVRNTPALIPDLRKIFQTGLL